MASDIERRGGAAQLDEAGRDFDGVLAAESADAIVAIGGTGSGRNDTSVQTLAREGRLAVHGMALTPGETAAFGFVGARPVLLLPGRLDAALAVWLTVGRRMLERLAGRQSERARAGRDLAAGAQGHVHGGLGRSRAGAAQRRTGSSRWRRNICRCRRWRAPTAGSWCRPTAKVIPPARRCR